LAWRIELAELKINIRYTLIQPKRKLYLHIGKHKTGTSAIQFFLLKNHDRLSQKGFAYPKHKFDANYVSSGNAAVLTQLVQNDFSQAQAFTDNILKTGEEKIILSSEFLYVLDYPGIEKIKSLFQNLSTKIIVYLRREDYLMSSGYNQMVKRRGVTENILDWWPKNLDQIRWSDTQLANWSDVFGEENIIVRPYEKGQFYSGDIFSDFLHALGLDLTEDFELPEKKINVSYRADTLEFMRLFNRLKFEEKQLKQLDWALQDYSANCNENHWPYGPLPSSDRIKIIEHFAEVNASIARKYLKRNDGRLFYDPLPAIHEDWKPYKLQKEDACRINTFLANKWPDLYDVVFHDIIKAQSSNDTRISNAANQLLPDKMKTKFSLMKQQIGIQGKFQKSRFFCLLSNLTGNLFNLAKNLTFHITRQFHDWIKK
jgi:hypothetical protein